MVTIHGSFKKESCPKNILKRKKINDLICLIYYCGGELELSLVSLSPQSPLSIKRPGFLSLSLTFPLRKPRFLLFNQGKPRSSLSLLSTKQPYYLSPFSSSKKKTSKPRLLQLSKPLSQLRVSPSPSTLSYSSLFPDIFPLPSLSLSSLLTLEFMPYPN